MKEKKGKIEMKYFEFFFLCFLFLFINDGLGNKEISIIYTNNVDGYLKSCNCPGNLFGGLIYVVDVVDQIKNENENVLYLDAGDLFPAKDWKPKIGSAIEYYNMIGADVLNIGDQELRFGVDYLVQQKNNANFAFLSANILYNDSLLFQPYIIKQFGDIKIGIIGIAEPEVFDYLDDDRVKGIKFNKYNESLSKYLKQIRSDVNVIILLSHAGVETDQKIASTHDGIDFIIGAHSGILIEKPKKIGTTIIMQAGKYAHYLGLLNLNFDKENNFVWKHDLIKLEGLSISKKAAEPYDRYMAESDRLIESASQQKALQFGFKNFPTFSDFLRSDFTSCYEFEKGWPRNSQITAGLVGIEHAVKGLEWWVRGDLTVIVKSHFSISRASIKR